MTHFTSQEAAAQILDGWRHEMLKQTSASEKFGPQELSLRLYSRYGMNDPTEYLHAPPKAGGGIGSQREDGLSHSRLVFPDTAFIYCGSMELRTKPSIGLISGAPTVPMAKASPSLRYGVRKVSLTMVSKF